VAAAVAHTVDDTAIEILGLSKRFGDFQPVKELSLDIRAGETFGLLGPNGAGKTTTLSMIATLLDLLTPEPVEHDPDLLLGGELPPGPAADLTHCRFGRLLLLPCHVETLPGGSSPREVSLSLGHPDVRLLLTGNSYLSDFAKTQLEHPTLELLLHQADEAWQR